MVERLVRSTILLHNISWSGPAARSWERRTGSPVSFVRSDPRSALFVGIGFLLEPFLFALAALTCIVVWRERRRRQLLPLLAVYGAALVVPVVLAGPYLVDLGLAEFVPVIVTALGVDPGARQLPQADAPGARRGVNA